MLLRIKQTKVEDFLELLCALCFSSFVMIYIFGQDYILLVPDSSYTPDLLKEKPLDKSADFIQQCRGEGFYIE